MRLGSKYMLMIITLMFLLSDVTTGTNLRGRGSFRAVNVTRMPQVVAFRLLWMGSFDSRWAALVPHPRLCRLIRWPMRTAFLSIGAHFRRQRPPHGRVTIHRHHQLLIHRLAPPNWWNHFFPFRLSPLPPPPHWFHSMETEHQSGTKR